MLVRIKHIFSLLLVLLLFAPSILKIEHEHEHFECHSKTEKHIHTEQETCNVCNFEYSVFSTNFNKLFEEKLGSVIRFSEALYHFFLTKNSTYSFLLRAPPTL